MFCSPGSARPAPSLRDRLVCRSQSRSGSRAHDLAARGVLDLNAIYWWLWVGSNHRPQHHEGNWSSLSICLECRYAVGRPLQDA
jgi:hypothetical protein